jgi:DNA-binding NarL/FixJ family response regulator
MCGAYVAEESKATKIKVLVASEFELVVEGMCRSLADCGDIQVIGQATDGKDSVKQAVNLHPAI